MIRKNDAVYVLIEWIPAENRVVVRGVFEKDDEMPKKLHPNNAQNRVGCFLGADMGSNVGFTFPDDDA